MSDKQTEVSPSELARRKQFKRNKWLFSASGIGRDMAYQLIASFLLTYIQFGVSLTLAQFTAISIAIGVIGRIWDAINDPLMGAIIEGTHMRWGKFKPWILIGAMLCGLTIVCMFGIQSIPGWRFVVFMCVMYLLWESTFTMNDIGYWAMLPSLSSVKEERNSVTMLTVLFAGMGAIIAQGVIPMVTVGDMRQGYRIVGIVVASVFVLSQIMTACGVKETPRHKNEDSKISIKHMFNTLSKNDQILWMSLSLLFYTIASALLVALAANLLYMEIGYDGTLYFYIVVAYGVPSVLVNVLYPWLVSKLGRKKLQLISICIACAGYALMGLMGWTDIFPFHIVIMAALAVLVSSGQSMFYMASIINMTNCVEYNDYMSGERNEAVVSTLRPFVVKMSTAIHTLMVTGVLALSGIFVLSQSISILETQRDYFAKMDGARQAAYIQNVQSYLEYYDGLEAGSSEYTAAANEVAAIIDADDSMNTWQLDAEYLPALAEAMISYTDESGNIVELGRLSEIDANALTADHEYSLEVGDTKSGSESAANLTFKDKSTLSMRVWLRFAACGIPMIFLIISLVIQRRKFIIDEEYYDMMVKSIAERDAQ